MSSSKVGAGFLYRRWQAREVELTMFSSWCPQFFGKRFSIGSIAWWVLDTLGTPRQCGVSGKGSIGQGVARTQSCMSSVVMSAMPRRVPTSVPGDRCRSGSANGPDRHGHLGPLPHH